MSSKTRAQRKKYIIAKGHFAWVRLTILETNRGSASRDVCVSEFLVYLEEFGND